MTSTENVHLLEGRPCKETDNGKKINNHRFISDNGEGKLKQRFFKSKPLGFKIQTHPPILSLHVL